MNAHAARADRLRAGWQTRAACRDTDPERFFPTAQDYGAVRSQVQAARAVCQSCPVLRDCRAWAVETGEAYGVWGGTTPTERREIRRQRAAGDPDPVIDQEPACRACSLLFAVAAVDGDLCATCEEAACEEETARGTTS